MAELNIRFGSVCSGIEAASVAWNPLGWRAAWLSEIEAFPSAVLAHHYPDVPNLGDMTTLPERIRSGEVEAPDVFCGGTPCQAFSVAGLRRSLDDARGNLSLTFCEIANAIDAVRLSGGEQPAVVFWENVPGVLNTKDNAFGCFLAGLAGEDDPLVPPGKKWSNAGCVYGPARAIAWRVLDAQYFGVAQRRRRVFVVASARKGFDPAAVLFEFDGVRRDTAPSREAGQAVAAHAARSVALRGREGGATAELGDELAGCLRASGGGGDKPHALAPVITMAHGQGGAEIGFDRGPTLTCNHEAPIAAIPETTHTLRGEGFDASEDGTGRGTPLVPVGTGVQYAYYSHDYAHDRLTDPAGVNPAITAEAHASGNLNVAVPVPVAFPANLSGTQCASTENLAPAMGAKNPTAVSYAIQAGALRTNPLSGPDGVGVQADHAYTLEARAEVQAVAVALRGREGGATAELGDDVQNCLRASTGGGDKPHVLCEALYNKGLNHGGLYASTQETHTGKILRALREEVGEETFAQWGLGILGSLQSPEILRQALHGLSIRPAAFSRSWVVHCALSRSENGSGWLLQSLREAGCERCASQGWEPSEQLTRELGAYLSELSQPGAQAARFVRDLRESSEGYGILRQALSAVQEVGRSSGSETQSAHRTYAIRRLTVEECEFLQGFPRGYTQIPWKAHQAWAKKQGTHADGKSFEDWLIETTGRGLRQPTTQECPDGPRYRALGNSWAVPVIRWIGRRIDAALRALDG